MSCLISESDFSALTYNYCYKLCADNHGVGTSGFGGCMSNCAPANAGFHCFASPPFDTVYIPFDTSGFCQVSPSAIDSLNQFFLDGFRGGILFSLPWIGGIATILVAVYLFVLPAKKI